MSKLILLTIFVAVPVFGFAQTVATDASIFNTAKQNTISQYHKFMGNEQGLYNGPMYTQNQMIHEGTPYLDSAKMYNGWVVYNNLLYKDVPLLYDVLRSTLITLVPRSENMLALISSRVDSFFVQNHRFVKLHHTPANNINTGFYEILFEGGSHTLYKFHQKEMQENTITGNIRRIVIDINKCYVKRGVQFYKIARKKDLLYVFNDKRKEIRDYMRKHKIRIRKNKDFDLSSVSGYYESITTGATNIKP